MEPATKQQTPVITRCETVIDDEERKVAATVLLSCKGRSEFGSGAGDMQTKTNITQAH
jgi:hypothetical protein